MSSAGYLLLSLSLGSFCVLASPDLSRPSHDANGSVYFARLGGRPLNIISRHREARSTPSCTHQASTQYSHSGAALRHIYLASKRDNCNHHAPVRRCSGPTAVAEIYYKCEIIASYPRKKQPFRNLGMCKRQGRCRMLIRSQDRNRWRSRAIFGRGSLRGFLRPWANRRQFETVDSVTGLRRGVCCSA